MGGPVCPTRSVWTIFCRLLTVGKSLAKTGDFRGIGRLSGLAFAGCVTFLTRSRASDPVTRVIWSSDGLVDWVNPAFVTDEVVDSCVSVDTVSGKTTLNTSSKLKLTALTVRPQVYCSTATL